MATYDKKLILSKYIECTLQSSIAEKLKKSQIFIEHSLKPLAIENPLPANNDAAFLLFNKKRQINTFQDLTYSLFGNSSQQIWYCLTPEGEIDGPMAARQLDSICYKLNNNMVFAKGIIFKNPATSKETTSELKKENFFDAKYGKDKALFKIDHSVPISKPKEKETTIPLIKKIAAEEVKTVPTPVIDDTKEPLTKVKRVDHEDEKLNTEEVKKYTKATTEKPKETTDKPIGKTPEKQPAFNLEDDDFEVVLDDKQKKDLYKHRGGKKDDHRNKNKISPKKEGPKKEDAKHTEHIKPMQMSPEKVEPKKELPKEEVKKEEPKKVEAPVIPKKEEVVKKIEAPVVQKKQEEAKKIETPIIPKKEEEKKVEPKVVPVVVKKEEPKKVEVPAKKEEPKVEPKPVPKVEKQEEKPKPKPKVVEPPVQKPIEVKEIKEVKPSHIIVDDEEDDFIVVPDKSAPSQKKEKKHNNVQNNVPGWDAPKKVESPKKEKKEQQPKKVASPTKASPKKVVEEVKPKPVEEPVKVAPIVFEEKKEQPSASVNADKKKKKRKRKDKGKELPKEFLGMYSSKPPKDEKNVDPILKDWAPDSKPEPLKFEALLQDKK